MKDNNDAGEMVDISYVSTHEFCGQLVTNYGVCLTTIKRGSLRSIYSV